MSSVKILLTIRPSQDVKHVTRHESAKVVRQNPGLGKPLSMLSNEDQQHLLRESVVPNELSEDLMEAK